MRRPVLRTLLLGLGLILAARAADAQAVATLDDLSALSPAQLDALFDRSAAGAIPRGEVYGRAIVLPGKALAGPASKASRLYWQGKNFRAEDATAINRFVGLPMIRGRVAYGPSCRDGAPCIVLDYSTTSMLYRNVRDELREVAPGLYLGLMYRTGPTPAFRRYFAFEDRGAVPE